MHRRDFAKSLALSAVGGLAALGAQATPAADVLAQIWRREGGVLMIRHTSTESGVGDPPEFTLGQCRTQRNLSAQGRQEALDLGAWMQAHKLQPDAVLSSLWCRCQDTARLAFGTFENWVPLNSTFAGQGDARSQETAMRARLRDLPAGRREVWVTHQVNMTALTESYPALGEGFLVDRQGRLLVRGRMP